MTHTCIINDQVLCNTRKQHCLLVQGEGLGVEDTQQGVEHEPLVGMAGK